MRVKLDCEISLPDSLVGDLMREFGLSQESGKVIIGGSKYKVAERIVTEYLINNRVSEKSKELDEIVTARIASFASIFGNINVGGVANKATPPSQLGVQPPVMQVQETTSSGQTVDISSKKMDKLRKISFK